MNKANPNPSSSAPAQDWNQLLLSLGCTLFLPITLLHKGGQWFSLSPEAVLLVALFFPFAYGVYEMVQKRKVSGLAILGLLSVVLMGSIGFFKLSKEWVAVNEAALPLLLGIAVIISAYTKKPLIQQFLYNEKVFRLELIEERLRQTGRQEQMRQLLRQTTQYFAYSFLFSAAMNLLMAWVFVKTDPADNLEQFNREIAAMRGWSWLLIALPAMAMSIGILYHLLRKIAKLTGLSQEEILRN